jgi:hypothetical protein
MAEFNFRSTTSPPIVGQFPLSNQQQQLNSGSVLAASSFFHLIPCSFGTQLFLNKFYGRLW